MMDRKQGDPERRDIKQRFKFHPGSGITGPKHAEVRSAHLVLALWVLDNVPASRERSLALTALQESMMWSNAAIAIHTEEEPRRARLFRDEA